MGMAFLHGQNGGGNLLRLKVVGSTSAPSNPKENTIWIKTSVPILECQLFFNEQVSGDFWKGAGNGSVYIPFQASNSAYNASTGANITVPKGNFAEFNVNFLGCKQLINAEWVNMDAYIYHGSSWIQFSCHRYYLYNYLDGQTAYDGITGGWNNYETVDGCVSISNLADMDTPTRCNSTIDCSGYTTLCVEIYLYEYTSGSSGFHYAIGNQTDNTIFSYGAIRGSFDSSTKNTWTTQLIDVSSLTTPVYVAIRGYYAKGAIRAMWLE